VERMGEGQRGGARAATSLKTTHGAALEQGVASGGVARRPAAALSRGRGGDRGRRGGGGGCQGLICSF
jgi:hypothetical protein